VTAAALALLVPMGAAAAPMLHVHLDDYDTDHHHGRALHGHLAGHEHHAPAAAATARLESHDDGRTLTPSLFVAVTPASFTLPAIVPERFVVAPPTVRAAHLLLQVTHGHDPPLAAAIAPRAPPARLS
jgi:hypothetical protein